MGRHSPALITSSTSCTASVHLCIGTSAKGWKRENSARRVRILQLSRKTTRKSVSRQQKEKGKAMATSSRQCPLVLSSSCLCWRKVLLSRWQSLSFERLILESDSHLCIDITCSHLAV